VTRKSLFPFAPYDEERAIYELRMEPRTTTYGSGVYEVGANGVRLFVTDSGRVFVPRGIVSLEDLMEVYKWGRLDAEIAAGTRKAEWDDDE